MRPAQHNTTPCSMGVGCDEYGVCYAAAHDQPEQCPHATPDKPARLMTNRELDDETERLNRIWPRDLVREDEIEEEKVRRG